MTRGVQQKWQSKKKNYTSVLLQTSHSNYQNNFDLKGGLLNLYKKIMPLRNNTLVEICTIACNKTSKYSTV